MSNKIALVTGAAGFIGKNLCSALRKQGYSVRAVVRNMLSGPWDEIEVIDLSTDAIPADYLEGVDTIFHLAGKAHALAETQQDKEEYFQINTEGTRKLLEAAQQAGVKSFIYFSSVKAVGDVNGIMDESVLAKADSPYGRSKRASEKLVLEGGYVPHSVVIRPSMVYGSSSKGNFSKMIHAIESGRFPPLPETHNRRSMVHVEDVVQAALLAAEKPEASGQTYIVTDGHEYSTREMYEWIYEALHKPVPNWQVPFSVLKALGKIGDAIGALRGKRFMFDSDALNKLTGNACYSSNKIHNELGFKPKHHLKEALPEIICHLDIQ